MKEHVTQASVAPDLKTPHLLVVDDDRTTRQMLKDLFEDDGLIVHVAWDGISALARLQDVQPDLILLDVRMPILDGFATCTRIRALPGGDELPVLMITSHDDDASVERAFAAGADDIVFKPLHIALLKGRVRNLIKGRRASLARRSSEARLAEAQQLAHVGSWTLELASDAFVASDEVARIFGHDPAARPTFKMLMEHVHPDDRAMVDAVLAAVLAGTSTFDVEHRIMRPNGEVRTIIAHGKLVLDAEGRPGYLVGSVQDITERKQAQDALARSNQQLMSMLESTTDAFYALDHAWRFTYVNHRAEVVLRRTRAELIGNNVWDEFPEAVDAAFYPMYHKAVAKQIPVTFEEWYAPLAAWFEVHAYPASDGLAVYFRDITERRRATEALHASEEYLRALVEHSAEIITVLGADGAVRYTSPAQRRLLGYEDEDSGDHMFDHVHPDDQPLLANLFQRFTEDSEPAITAELRVRHRDGSWRVFEATGTNLLDNPAVRGIVINSHDITERKRAQEQLAHDAFHDALTGLANRALFLDRLGQSLERIVREPKRCCAVLFLDLDRFKLVNDSLGHDAGDLLLVHVARRLERCVRPGDTVARLGGDEFAILLEDMAATHAATDVAERIAAEFEASFQLQGQEIVTSASIGIALSAPEGTQPDDLLRNADIAMYSAKRRGPGHHIVADPTMHAGIMARLQLEADLRHAVEHEEFVLYYQPKMAIDGRRILGVEALVRWQHPVRGFVSPADFIPLVEETGLIVPLGEWVLRTACAQARSWHAAGLTGLTIAVNVSAHQFKQPGLAAMIRTILDETGLDAGDLCLELTESLLMEDAPTTIATLHELRAVGIGGLAIDDFGTGYSSLSYLQRFPVTELKIDRSFVLDVMTSPNSAAIATSIIALAHSLGLNAIAEGIETEEQRVFLEHVGCDRFQGYLASRPLPASDVEKLLQSGAGTQQ
jgi:diguanylate cyclase (GGDEF)-like protein/PAS domain S-box-containing protein